MAKEKKKATDAGGINKDVAQKNNDNKAKKPSEKKKKINEAI
jgi:hypothetical protein